MNIIETKNLTKYYGKSRGIIDVNLEVKEGEIFGFIGPNGAGKSTTIRTLLKLIYPTGGSAKIFNKDIIKQSKEIKKDIGFISSEINYYDKMSVKELLDYSAKFYKINAKKKINELAELFNVNISKKFSDLSLGNKKKVSILQALIHQPKLLILDEPTNGLDPLMQARFFDVLRKENEKGTTIFFSSHILDEVQKFCKRVAIIKDGRIVKIEDIETLRKKHLKKIEVSFDKHIQKEELNINGVLNIIQDNSNFKFVYDGNINNLLKLLIDKPITNLSINESSLEEIFMHYYEDEKSIDKEVNQYEY